MFKVKVQGDYVARSGVMDKEKIKKSYEIEGVIPTLTAALSIVKNKLLAPALSKKYHDYVTFLTYHIVEITPLTPAATEQMSKAEVEFMNRPTLIKHIRDLALPVDARFYPDLFKLREAVTLAKEDAEGYKKQFELRKADLLLDLQMAEANPGLFNTTAPESGIVASIDIKPKRKASTPDVLAVKTEDRLTGLGQDMIRDGEMGEMDKPKEDLDL